MTLVSQVRRRWCWLLALVVMVGFAIWLEPTRVVWGWLRGEAFYQGRPTSWWASELDRWECHVAYLLMDVGGRKICRRHEHYFRKDTEFEQLWKRWFPSDAEPPVPTALTGDPAAQAVLLALVEHPSEQVQKMAIHGLLRLGQQAASQREEQAEDAQDSP
jgi:hypothetical protein